ncbi:MAG: peptidylprolyl isomerase [Prevotellaceae bacterium]|nr:peptidylprolyl isomerase [Prevotellaceae bacterium]
MIRKLFLLIALFAFMSSAAQTNDTIRAEVLLETTMGNIKVALYNETPKHRDNFIKLVKEGFYDGLLFHRVIASFMIQGGDSASRNAVKGQLLGDSPEGYTIPAEIRYPEIIHKRGALAAAREGDNVNPERASSASQFYIVYGKRFNDEMLDKVQRRIDETTNGTVKLTPEARECYKKKGGTPHLDGQYTVFGEVIEGINVVADIEFVETDDNDRPVEDVRIIKATVVKDIE